MTLLERLQQPVEPTRKALILTAPWGREVRRILYLKHLGQLTASSKRISLELAADGVKISEASVNSWGTNADILEVARQEFEADSKSAAGAGAAAAGQRPDNPPAERGGAKGRRR
jgi:hypothetical protein